jgi:hypothetical protein
MMISGHFFSIVVVVEVQLQGGHSGKEGHGSKLLLSTYFRKSGYSGHLPMMELSIVVGGCEDGGGGGGGLHDPFSASWVSNDSKNTR